jgi:hypothetical protein
MTECKTYFNKQYNEAMNTFELDNDFLSLQSPSSSSTFHHETSILSPSPIMDHKVPMRRIQHNKDDNFYHNNKPNVQNKLQPNHYSTTKIPSNLTPSFPTVQKSNHGYNHQQSFPAPQLDLRLGSHSQQQSTIFSPSHSHSGYYSSLQSNIHIDNTLGSHMAPSLSGMTINGKGSFSPYALSTSLSTPQAHYRNNEEHFSLYNPQGGNQGGGYQSYTTPVGADQTQTQNLTPTYQSQVTQTQPGQYTTPGVPMVALDEFIPLPLPLSGFSTLPIPFQQQQQQQQQPPPEQIQKQSQQGNSAHFHVQPLQLPLSQQNQVQIQQGPTILSMLQKNQVQNQQYEHHFVPEPDFDPNNAPPLWA